MKRDGVIFGVVLCAIVYGVSIFKMQKEKKMDEMATKRTRLREFILISEFEKCAQALSFPNA